MGSRAERTQLGITRQPGLDLTGAVESEGQCLWVFEPSNRAAETEGAMADADLMPAFISPLTDQEHARLGRIAVLWGHLDFILDELILHILNLTVEQRAKFIGEKPMGPKLEFIRPELGKIKHDDARSKAKEFFRLLNDTKAKRNHVFHGVWGWRAPPKKKKPEICARHPKSLQNPVRNSDLTALERTLCQASHAGFRALELLREWTPSEGPARFAHGKGPPPEWYVQWTEQHPLRVENLDRKWQLGELPRLVDPIK